MRKTRTKKLSESEREFVKYIREAREEKGITREQLADMSDISKNSLSDYELGYYDIPLNKAERLCQALGVTYTLGYGTVDN